MTKKSYIQLFLIFTFVIIALLYESLVLPNESPAIPPARLPDITPVVKQL